jgi:dipeptidyl aminopeptidase/acylaminoacyl peptidase
MNAHRPPIPWLVQGALVIVLFFLGACQPPRGSRADHKRSAASSRPPAAAPHPSATWKPLPSSGSFFSASEYLKPPDEVVRLLEHEPEPQVVLHAASSRFVQLFEQPLIPMPQLARRRLALGGLRIDPSNRTQGTDPLFTRLVVGQLTDRKVQLAVTPPEGALFGDVAFSPSGARLAVSLVYADQVLVGVVDTTTGALVVLPTGPLSAVWGAPCSFRTDVELLCARPQFDGTAPRVEVKPNIVELIDGAAATVTYTNLLRNQNDDLLLEHYSASQLFLFDLELDKPQDLALPGLITAAALSPNGRYLMTERLERPYPRLLPIERFQKQLSILDLLSGDVVLRIAAPGEAISTSTPWGPRAAGWDPAHPARILYIYREPNDGPGDTESLIARVSPFESTPTVLGHQLNNTKSWGFTSAGRLYLVDSGKTSRTWATYSLSQSGQKLLAHGAEGDVIGDLGRALKVNGERGAVLEHQGKFYFQSEEVAENEPYTRLSEWDSTTTVTRPLWRNLPTEYASILAVLDPALRRYLIRTETPTIPPYLAVSEMGMRRAITTPAPAFAELKGVTRQQIVYRRADSVLLSAMLYLPAQFKPGKRLPTVFWIYPKDYSDQQQASRVTTQSQRYFEVRGPSRFSVLTQGYALVDAPSMPIVGDIVSGRDDYLPQLISSAAACIDYLVELGIAERGNIAAMGRSYGALAVANLMAHSTLFKTGIAMSGAYNRTLTPFGYQRETRTFWQNTEAYVNLSPFFFADKVQGPLLLLHGEDDDNPGTPAFQSDRFYAALAGNGVKSRYVAFPFEGHQFRGRKTVLHASAEIIHWLDRHLKTPP